MGTSYSDTDVQCPFFLSCESVNKWSSITCEGIDLDEKTRLKLQFTKRADMEAYKETICSSEDYEKKCIINQMLEKKYRDHFEKEKLKNVLCASRHSGKKE